MKLGDKNNSYLRNVVFGNNPFDFKKKTLLRVIFFLLCLNSHVSKEKYERDKKNAIKINIK